MTHTIEMIEVWLDSDLHDVYSKRELEEFLKSILDSLKREQEDIIPDPDHQQLKDQYQEILRQAHRKVVDAFSEEEFDGDIELDLNNREIEATIDGKMVVDRIWTVFEESLPTPEEFISEYKAHLTN